MTGLHIKIKNLIKKKKEQKHVNQYVKLVEEPDSFTAKQAMASGMHTTDRNKTTAAIRGTGNLLQGVSYFDQQKLSSPNMFSKFRSPTRAASSQESQCLDACSTDRPTPQTNWQFPPTRQEQAFLRDRATEIQARVDPRGFFQYSEITAPPSTQSISPTRFAEQIMYNPEFASLAIHHLDLALRDSRPDV